MSSLKQVTNNVVFILGPTGSGKSRLAIDLAILFNGEIINSDKIQVYKGLDIITNKVTDEESRGVPHHLLGIVEDPDQDFTIEDFVRHAKAAADGIVNRGRLPIVAGGSNSFIKALVDDDEFHSKYDSCFLWVDVSTPVLHSFVGKRVDEMVRAGLVDEVRELFTGSGGGPDYSRGIWRAIGVPEMDEFFKNEGCVGDEARAKLLKVAIDEVKKNTCELTHRQLEKIFTMGKEMKWREFRRLDATEAFIKRDDGDAVAAAKAWQRSVVGPSTSILCSFLFGGDDDDHTDSKSATVGVPPSFLSNVVTISSVNN